MRLSWNEIRTRAAVFAQDWQDAHYEKGETQSFYDAFFNVFGIERRQVARFEENVKKLDNRTGFIDLFWPKVLIAEQKSAGRNLEKAAEQASEYFDALPDDQKPRFQLVCDFQNFELLDRDTRETIAFPLKDLPKHVEKFRFILGRQTQSFKDQDPVNIKAAELVGHLHDALYAANYRGHDLEVFLTRIVFCLFADDTGIFEPRDLFLNFLLERTREDGSDMGGWLAQLFQVLNTPESTRQSTLDEDLARFPYVNGGLFEGAVNIPAFNSDMRERLIDASRFNWAPISPAIFGSLFQSVMNAKERRAAGAHYTTEMNILKVIGPLFMDDLRAEFTRLKALKSGRKKRLHAFHDSLRDLTFFDPACGCGNFLIIAYRELRLLELEILHALHDSRQKELDAGAISKIDVDQFFGIEIGEFPARIAETALWMMDHIMNMRLSAEFGQVFLRIPLKRSPRIVHGDALEVDWEDVIPAKTCSFVLGNPPFVGKTYQTKEQKASMARVFANVKGGKLLDFVAAWFLKAAIYIKNSNTNCAFVSTNSITQGEQVSILWGHLLEHYGIIIRFAHQTFAWGSEARGKAAVHCIIIGFGTQDKEHKQIFEYETPTAEPEGVSAKTINPYLVDAPPVVVVKQRKPLSSLSPMKYGSKPADGGHLILTDGDKEQLVSAEPNAAKFLRRYIGSQDLINGGGRWCLWLNNAEPQELKPLSMVRDRIAKVREFRLASSDANTRKWAEYPSLFQTNRQPLAQYLAVPEVSSERRQYVPIGYLDSSTVASNKLYTVSGATLSDFALLTSAMHMAWMRSVTGRLKSDYQYSASLVYNTFPLPGQNGKPKDLSKLDPLAQAVLDARANHADATLADLYDPDLMPADLRRAHNALDRAVDKLYRRSGFQSERERVEHLFGLYEKMMAPLLAAKSKRRRAR